MCSICWKYIKKWSNTFKIKLSEANTISGLWKSKWSYNDHKHCYLILITSRKLLFFLTNIKILYKQSKLKVWSKKRTKKLNFILTSAVELSLQEGDGTLWGEEESPLFRCRSMTSSAICRPILLASTCELIRLVMSLLPRLPLLAVITKHVQFFILIEWLLSYESTKG